MKKEEFDEKFIDVEIGEITKKWQLTHAYNICTSRISPLLIDGLKPVVRRALYIMYLKDGGRRFRKIATISGEVFGRVHPHSPVAIEDAIVNVAQPWHNILPLVEGFGNFGSCFSDDTEVAVMHIRPDDPTRELVEWIPIKDFKDMPGQCVSANIETGEWIWETPSDIIQYPFSEKFPDGKMTVGKYALSKTSTATDIVNQQLVNFKVTPDHNLILKKMDPREYQKFEFIKAEDIPEISQMFSKVKREEINPVDFKVIQKAPDELARVHKAVIKKDESGNEVADYTTVMGREMPLVIYFEALAIFLALGKIKEGKIKCDDWIGPEPDWLNPFKSFFGIDDLKEFVEGGIIGYLHMVGEPEEGPDEIITDAEGNETIKPQPPYDPHIPADIFRLDKVNIEKFLEKYCECARSKTPNIKCRTERLQGQFQILLMLTSHVTQIGNIENGKDPYAGDPMKYLAQGIKDFEVPLAKMQNISEEDYGGDVYCLTMPKNHTLAVRREKAAEWMGNCAGDRAGASRYIQARLSEYSIACFFEDWKDSVVDMELAYDEETKMPLYLPAKYPNILINGCLGIGYGLAALYPAFNFREVVEATILLMHNPKANIILIPDSPTGADIIETDFARICNTGRGSYMQRCTYEIDAESNMITITSLPDLSTANDIRERIADIKEKGGLAELITMNDLSGKTINIQLIIRDDVNPYRFMKKLISQISGLEKTYPVSIVVSSDYMVFEYSIKQVLLEWIKWRREQKRVVVSNKRGTLMAEQRVIDIKLFIMNKQNLQDTLDIFRNSHNRQEIENKLIAKYHDTDIKMDSVQARALSNMRMIELTIDAYEEYKKRGQELIQELAEIENILNTENGIDKTIIAELRDGIKRFGTPRRSNVVPYEISVSNDVEGTCILQLNSDGMITRVQATNAEEEPIPTDSNGFACLVDNDSSFILVNDQGYHTFIRVKDLPLDSEVPVFRYTKKVLDGTIVAMLPVDIESNRCCTLVSKQGIVKRIKIADIGPSKKPLIAMEKEDRLVKGIVLKEKSQKDLLVYTKNGMGQRLDPNSIRITSPLAKGGNGFKLANDDEICGVYAISPESNAYLLYVTSKGKMRLNNIEYLPTRESKHDKMVQLISLNDRDKLVAVLGCNKLDKAVVYFDDATSEVIDISKIPESTMSSEPKKLTNKNAVSNNVIKARIQ